MVVTTGAIVINHLINYIIFGFVIAFVRRIAQSV